LAAPIPESKLMNETLEVQETEQEYKDCGLHLSEYQVTKLPRGGKDSHAEFQPVRFKTAPRRGPKTKTDEQLHAEQVEMYKKKELKLEVHTDE